MKTERRTAIKKMFASTLGLAGLSIVAKAGSFEKKITDNVVDFQDRQRQPPLFPGHTKFGNLVFVSGKGAHVEPFTIENHTEIVLKSLEEELIRAGSSMEKCLKATVYLNDIADYDGMNAVYRGRFGANPPCRSTIAVAKGGVPGDSLVEIDVIAYI